MKSPVRKVLTAVGLGLLLASCGSYGPKTMDRDQINYGNSIGDTWKNQMLANIVKIRFVDMPVFVDVGSIVSGYTLSTTVNGRLGFSDSITGGNSQGLGASGTYTDRPTITYMPKTGNDYLRAILEPVAPTNLLALIQAGYSSELLFTWAVEAINGVHNWSVTRREDGRADPEFIEYVQLMQELQNAGAVGFELTTDENNKNGIVFRLKKEGLAESTIEKSRRVAEIIGLDPDRDQFRVIYAPFKSAPDTLAIQTRSVLQMLSALSGFIDVPAEKAAYAAPGYDFSGTSHRPFQVHSAENKPDESFAQVKYEGYWYWIENSDLMSKRVFSLMLFITTLTNQAKDANAPILTIPTS
ncbi:hypothetical protein ACFL07_00260 [Pseudomonadota bacterium]